MSWESQIEAWDSQYGPKKFIPWSMSGSSRITAVWEALKRFESDLQHHAITQDGCPITITHMRNARRFAKSGERYGLGKPKQTRKIDAAVTWVPAHEAACDARAAGWGRKRKAYLLTGSTDQGVLTIRAADDVNRMANLLALKIENRRPDIRKHTDYVRGKSAAP